MYNWIQIIDSKENYKKLWETLVNFRELHLGSFIVIDGFLTCKDGRIVGKEGELIAAIITYTYEKKTMENMIYSGIFNSSMIVLSLIHI